MLLTVKRLGSTNISLRRFGRGRRFRPSPIPRTLARAPGGCHDRDSLRAPARWASGSGILTFERIPAVQGSGGSESPRLRNVGGRSGAAAAHGGRPEKGVVA